MSALQVHNLHIVFCQRILSGSSLQTICSSPDLSRDSSGTRVKFWCTLYLALYNFEATLLAYTSGKLRIIPGCGREIPIYLLSAINYTILKYCHRYIKIIAFVLKLNAGFSKLIKFPHPGYLNSEALPVATCLSTLKARHNYLSVEVANAEILFNGEIALYCLTCRIALR